jgi:DNA-binding response OmpR family regulator
VTVVIAGDQRIISDPLALILNGSGFEAVAVYSGEAAVEVLGSFEPDLLLRLRAAFAYFPCGGPSGRSYAS